MINVVIILIMRTVGFQKEIYCYLMLILFVINNVLL
jgi:hypothetical protein